MPHVRRVCGCRGTHLAIDTLVIIYPLISYILYYSLEYPIQPKTNLLFVKQPLDVTLFARLSFLDSFNKPYKNLAMIKEN